MELMEDPVNPVETEASRQKGKTRVQRAVSTPTPEEPLLLQQPINAVSTNQELS